MANKYVRWFVADWPTGAYLDHRIEEMRKAGLPEA